MAKLAILFPGQGAQYVGMGYTFYRNFKQARDIYEEASDSLGYDVKKLCFESDLEELIKTKNAQPAILTTSIAAFQVLVEETGIVPDYLAGHSLGEISALVAAGVIPFSTAVRIVRLRGELMQKETALGIGSMLAVRDICVDTIREECKNHESAGEVVQISNYNSINQTVISGNKSVVEIVGRALEAKGAHCIPLQVSAPFHSALMKPVAEQFRAEIRNYSFGEFQTPVLSNVTASPYFSRENIVDLLSSQIYRSVNWLASMQFLKQEGVDLVIDVGPNCSLFNLMRDDFSSIRSLHMDKTESLIDFFTSVTTKGQTREEIPPHEAGIHLIQKCLAFSVCTPNLNNNQVEYQEGAAESIRELNRLHDQLNQEKQQPTEEQILLSLNLLRRIFLAKKTPIGEQYERVNQLSLDNDKLQQFFTWESFRVEV